MRFRRLLLSDLALRRIGPDDSGDLSRLHQMCFSPGWSSDGLQDLFINSKAWGYGLRGPNEWIGFILILPVVDDAEIVTLATRPDRRGKGLAGHLLDAVIRETRRLGINRLLLDVAEDNAPALRLYVSRGFQTDGRRKGYYTHNGQPSVDAILMSRPI